MTVLCKLCMVELRHVRLHCGVVVVSSSVRARVDYRFLFRGEGSAEFEQHQQREAIYAAAWQADEETGKTIYGYTMDSCADANFWCQNDPNHLDFSEPYLDTMGYTGQKFNGRKISWSYMSGTPDGCAPPSGLHSSGIVLSGLQ